MRIARITLYTINCLACLSAIVQDKGFLFPYLIFGLSVLLIILEFSLDGEKEVKYLYNIKYTYNYSTLSYFVYAADKETALKTFKKEISQYKFESILSIQKVETE